MSVGIVNPGTVAAKLEKIMPDEKDREAWLAKVHEDALEPELPIVDPHHHLWDHPGSRYMLDEILRDTGSGHRVLMTVFVECMSM